VRNSATLSRRSSALASGGKYNLFWKPTKKLCNTVTTDWCTALAGTKYNPSIPVAYHVSGPQERMERHTKGLEEYNPFSRINELRGRRGVRGNRYPCRRVVLYATAGSTATEMMNHRMSGNGSNQWQSIHRLSIFTIHHQKCTNRRRGAHQPGIK